MVYASTYLCLLQFSLVSFNFLRTGLLHLWLNLFLGILFFFEAIVNGIVFLITFSDSSFVGYKNATNFCIFILYLATYLIHMSVLVVFFVGICRVLYIQYHII